MGCDRLPVTSFYWNRCRENQHIMDLPISIYMPFKNKDDVLRSSELGVGKREKKIMFAM